jgi:hypothetical protein
MESSYFDIMWQTRKSLHYVLHYHPGSLAERDIDEIIELQETCFDYICRVLQVDTDTTINYFLCDTREEVGAFYGDNDPANGFNRMPNEIYTVYSDDVKCTGFHEDAHLISYNTIARPKSALLRESLAMYFNRVLWRIPNQAWVQVILQMGFYPGLTTLSDNEIFFAERFVISYSVAGVFADYLISIFGINKFKAFYSGDFDNFEEGFFSIFGTKLDDFDRSIKRYLQTIRYEDSIYTEINRVLKKLPG